MVRYDLDYAETIEIDGGVKVQLRLLRPEDSELLREGFEHLSERSRTTRFHGGKRRLSDHDLVYLTHVDHDNHLAIGARLAPPDPTARGIAVARFVRFADDPSVADVAVTVTDEMQHRGLGTALCQRLVEAARERGLRRLHFEVLAANQPMLALLEGLGATRLAHSEDGVVSAELDLASEPLQGAHTEWPSRRS